jgi:transposase
MTKMEQNRVLAWRLKVLREASAGPRNVAQACRHFGLSRKAFYKWKARYEALGEAGLCDRPRAPHRSLRTTPREVVSKILYLRQHYHFGLGRTADYLQRFHQLKPGTLLSPPHSDSPWAKPTASQSEASPSWASVAAL